MSARPPNPEPDPTATHRLADVPADIDDYLASLNQSRGLSVDVPWGTLYVRGAGPGELEVVEVGRGGGFVDQRTVSRDWLRRRVRDLGDRAALSRPAPIAEVWPRRFREGSQ